MLNNCEINEYIYKLEAVLGASTAMSELLKKFSTVICENFSSDSAIAINHTINHMQKCIEDAKINSELRAKLLKYEQN